MDSNRKGDVSLIVYGIMGLVNVAGVIVVWFYFIGPTITVKINKFIWYSWFVIFLLHLVIWAPMVVFWPLAYIGNITILQIINLWAQLGMYGGGYGGYEVCLILIIVGMGVNYDGGWTGTPAIAWAIIIGYAAEAALSAFLSFWFYPYFTKWYLEQ